MRRRLREKGPEWTRGPDVAGPPRCRAVRLPAEPVEPDFDAFQPFSEEDR
ncbi:hypothetical protein FHR83_000175 [Actinoplanes campanulatus]|uniref:Uncharacterized protein n=1 Tax=Actinoplanes campanulatus TaxID=113559 RepID=A0A7W5AAD2_9ACTN|nr:hypothetical protein [Actinoplanes campanulatus]MBB3092541.1 hypothetical protein [Actinoplanes campanulatus]